VKPIAFLRECFRMALQDLGSRPLRSVLSVLSFSLGIATSVVLVALGEGVRAGVKDILSTLGEGQIIVTPGRTTGIGGQRRAGRPVRIRYEDTEGLAAHLPSFQGVASYFDMRGGGASSYRYSIPWSPVRAVDREYFNVRQVGMVEGRWISDVEEEEGRWVAVLNEALAKVVFPEGGAIGQWIEWRGRRMTVVGVIRDEAVFPYTLFLPYRTVMEMADARYITGLIARPILGESWARATRELQRVLGGLGGFDPNDANALEIEDNSAFTSRVEAVTTALHALVAGIAGVSLLLGGLGVANLMVIAVTERTREIGLRKALGASPGSIFCQILCESLTVLSVGGFLGIAAGWTTCVALGSIRVSATYTAHARFDPASAALSLLGLALVAALASIIPARRAAALPAAEALRWE
jgi:putative ABC transport system permease protein